MSVFVINEWLWSDLSGSNGRTLQLETFVFIEKFPASGHRIVFIEGSAFDQKAWGLCRNTNPMMVQRLGGAFVTNIRQNSDCCVILKPHAVAPLPQQLASATNPDDHYLLQAQLATFESILVTTDHALHQAANNAGLTCILRAEFLGTYC